MQIQIVPNQKELQIEHSNIAQKIVVSVVLSIVVVAFFRNCLSDNKVEKSRAVTAEERGMDSAESIKKELEEIDSALYLYNYIVDVINNGSNHLNFPGGEMEGGYASSADAPKIACFVIEHFQRQKCPKDIDYKDAQMYYTSICGGCHGNDAKGINGNFPNLNRVPLLGIKKRKSYLLQQLKIVER